MLAKIKISIWFVCTYHLPIIKGFFNSIDHKFPEVGHSYIDPDRDFGRIEKIIRRQEKIFAPQQFLIKNACKKNAKVTEEGENTESDHDIPTEMEPETNQIDNKKLQEIVSSSVNSR